MNDIVFYLLVSMICGTIIILGIFVYPMYLMSKEETLRLKIKLKEFEKGGV